MTQYAEMTEEYYAAGRYLAYLIGCAIKGGDAAEKPDGVTWEQVYMLAQNNSVEGLSYYGMATVKQLPPDSIYRHWKEDADRGLFRELHFDMEREQIVEEMVRRGLSFLPFKGIRLAGLYPKPGMRSMSDNDILYGFVEADPAGGFRIKGTNEKEQKASVLSAQKTMTEIMSKRGYQAPKGLTGNHDGYLKAPFYNFEMHRKLMLEGSPHYGYYKNPWKRAVAALGNDYEYFFSDEDEYLFFLAHWYKHFEERGCGIRCLADQYVFLEKKEASMDWEYVRDELRIMKLSGYEEMLKSLSGVIFEKEAVLNETEERLFYDLLGCGTYGNRLAKMERAMERSREEGKTFRQAKWDYLWNKVFLPLNLCKEYYPFFYRHRCLLVVLPFYRLWKKMRYQPGVLGKELRNLWNYKR